MKTLLIVGAGLAGLSAALEAVSCGAHAIIVSAYPSERAQSVMAEGGINAALNTKGEDDSPAEHCADTLKSAKGLTNEDAVRAMTEEAPAIVRWLYGLGVQFNMDGANIDLRNFGGQKKKRTAYAKSATGKHIMSSLCDAVRRLELSGEVTRYPHHDFVTLLLNGNRCGGIVMRDRYTGEMTQLHGSGVCICTGGFHGLFAGTTGNNENTGSAVAELFRLGATVANAEMIQYHPTCTALSAGKRRLISEAARSEGGKLFTIKNGARYYFMEEKYPEMGDLMPRDVTSREIWYALREGPVYMDISFLPKGVLKNKLAEIVDVCKTYMGIDATKVPIPVEPGIHYFMGGLRVDIGHRVNDFENVYAAGECCCMYHGANRLGGNSLLGALYGGKVSARSACEECTGAKNVSASTPLPLGPVGPMRLLNGEALGVVRDGETMSYAIEHMEKLDGALPLLSRAVLKSALARKESRGAHFRKDCPKTDERFTKLTCAKLVNGEIKISFQEA